MPTLLTEIRVHPVKSMAIRRLDQAQVEPWGLADDRRWMVIDASGECVTARELSALFTVTAEPSEHGLMLRTRQGDEAQVSLSGAHGIPVTVHGRGPLTATGSAPDVDQWLCRVLGTPGLRLVHVESPRPLNPQYARPGEATAFADGYPVTLASAASLRQLQTWIGAGGEQIGMDRFRPNLVVDGGLDPFAEDGWARITIGDITFRVAKGVDRCSMTLTDPATLARGPEPIRSLAAHRKWDGATWFAMQLIPEGSGTISLGDQLTVTEMRRS